MRFLRNLVASIIGTLIAFAIVFILLVAFASAFSEIKTVSVTNNSVLEIDLDKTVKDYAPKSSDPIDELLGYNKDKIGLNSIINAIENATSDENIKGISIHLSSVNAGISQIQAIRDKLLQFKESGKFIYAYADIYSQKAYYLSSVADSVFVNPVGEIDFKGLSSEVLFLSELQEKTGVKMEVIRHGKYKSAVEPFLANTMSDENRSQISSYLTSIWNELIADISESRNLTVDDLNTIADNLLGRNATSAVENKLVDGAIYMDEYEDKLIQQSGSLSDVNLVTIEDYISTGKGRLTLSSPNKIAVLYAQGEIIYGEGDESFIGQELIIKALKKIRNANDVKALVLRVNSPGGSALASELIWREIELTKKVIPVVVSMGDVAASGGYYLSCNADHIFAEPTTITGSIGVFGTIPNISKLAENMGINAEQVSTNKSAKYSFFEPMTDEFRVVTQEGVEQIYTTFLNRVSYGRNKSVEAIDSIAQGRVWSGVEAVENGLVDELGTLEDAVSYAAGLAGITDYKVRNYPNYNLDLEDKFSNIPLLKSKEKILIEELGESNYKIYQSIKRVSTLKGIQARLPYIIEIN